MTTPTSSFLAVAERYGNVDPTDAEAVQHWFTEVLPTLPPETVEQILEELLKDVGTPTDGRAPRSYPQDVPIPSLTSSPPAAVPLLATGWRELLLLMRRRSRSSG